MSVFNDEKCSIFGFFEEISEIPRVSGNTAPIADYLERFAKERSLKYERDSADNVIIYKNATAGYEGRPTVILQGHTDMVGAVAPDVCHDFDKEGVTLLRDGDILRADGTTLGGDNGTAVAYMLALLEGGEDVVHPALECVFTSNEEIGLLGAAAIDASLLRGRMMINLDSDGEGAFVVGCAGGVRIDISLPCGERERQDGAYTISLTGLRGGHSGADINEGRLNAIVELSRIVSELKDLRICDFSGGTADNVIPSSANVTFTASESLEAIEARLDEARLRLSSVESDAELTLSVKDSADALNAQDSRRLISLLGSLPFGVYAMSRELEGAVETSNNIGVISAPDGEVKITVSVRSSVAAEKDALAKKIETIAKGYGAVSSRRGDYPGWAYKSDSRLREIICRAYREMTANEPCVYTIHAGLECGIFADKLAGLDCVSMGPDNEMIHTVNERLSIASFKRTYEFLRKVLREI